MEIASPSGGRIPLDPESLSHEVLAELGTGRHYVDREFMDLLEDTERISEVNLDDYDAIYPTGGHGVMFDFPQSENLEALMARFYESDKVVATVCHGATGLLNVQLSGGEPLVQGKRVTGFSWREEELAQRADAVPYSLQEELRKLGADYRTADEPFVSFVVEDGNLITGRNPGSAAPVAEAGVRKLETTPA
ncbi:type 1 glutamine amidotransferase domain-containing protein [Streptomyces sp. NPDC046931]|uniref:type 1 glutamine amidotransferase domain-containing protein n=1 Tax=Streptomyces sp. NPDC046931 TaxID=3154806 RepID=UPI0033EAF2C3